MDQKTFRAMVVKELPDNKFVREITTKSVDELPEGEVLIRVKYSSLNYKDALSAIGNRGVTKNYPHTPGVDAAGVVEESSVDEFQPGDEVIVTGYDLGMNTAGGYGEYIRVPANWLVRRPENLSLRESMAYGTAGFTASLSVFKLLGNGVTPDRGEVLVSGGPGGVGSIALSILAKSGYQVVGRAGGVRRSYRANRRPWMSAGFSIPSSALAIFCQAYPRKNKRNLSGCSSNELRSGRPRATPGPESAACGAWNSASN